MYHCFSDPIDTVIPTYYNVPMTGPREAQTLEVETDARGRVPLGKMVRQHQRFRATTLDDGEILLTPVVVISERELALLRNPEMSGRLRASIAEAEAGKLVPYVVDESLLEDDED
jgi:hypothetical protein